MSKDKKFVDGWKACCINRDRDIEELVAILYGNTPLSLEMANKYAPRLYRLGVRVLRATQCGRLNK